MVSGCLSFRASMHSSKTMHARVLKFHTWIPHGKIADTHFLFLSELTPFLELCPFEKLRMKSDACHILWTMHARVLKFHIWVPHGKIADPSFFSCLSYLPLWSYAPLKKSEWHLVSKISRKSIWARGLKLCQLIGKWWVDYLMKLKKKSPYFSGVNGPLNIWAF